MWFSLQGTFTPLVHAHAGRTQMLAAAELLAQQRQAFSQERERWQTQGLDFENMGVEIVDSPSEMPSKRGGGDHYTHTRFFMEIINSAPWPNQLGALKTWPEIGRIF